MFNGEVLVHDFVTTTENVVFEWDAITKFHFLIDEGAQKVYRAPHYVPKAESFKTSDHRRPFMVTGAKMVIKTHSQVICISERSGVETPSDMSYYSSPSLDLPLGLEIQPFVSENANDGLFNIYISKKTDQVI